VTALITGAALLEKGYDPFSTMEEREYERTVDIAP